MNDIKKFIISNHIIVFFNIVIIIFYKKIFK